MYVWNLLIFKVQALIRITHIICDYRTIKVRLISKVYLCLISKQTRIPTVFLLSTDSKIDRPKHQA